MSNSQEPFLALNLPVSRRFLQRDSLATALPDWMGTRQSMLSPYCLLVLSKIDCHLAVVQFPEIVRKLR